MKRLLLFAVVFTLQCSLFNVYAQVDISGKVFGGARQADVGGHTFVHIGADNHDIIINEVYGGNDIAGSIGGNSEALPAELTEATENHIDNTWNAIVKVSTKTTTNSEGQTVQAEDAKRVIIGQLFGGGNGDYTYSAEKANGKYDATITYTVWDPTLNNNAGGYDQNHTVTLTDIVKPELAKTYLELDGGCIAHAYGGGNNATVTENTTININNPSKVLGELLTETELQPANFLALANRLGLATFQSNVNIKDYNFARVFGGNNKADMAIMPTWNLKDGNIRDLYSGGNEGRMISEKGILLEIPAASTILVDNVYGGCRKADVRPMTFNQTTKQYQDVTHVYNLAGYKFPDELAARVLIRGGNVNNVYGGNDIRGRVYFGNAIGIYASIRGDVYGGGNGSYDYTDNAELANSDPQYQDFYYNPIEELGLTGNTFTPKQSAEALNLVRPNAAQVSIRLYGTDEAHPTIIGGSVYCGGNSATLKADPAKLAQPETYPNYPLVELKIGSNIKADKVFLGCNGENMVDQSSNGILAQYNGVVTSTDGNSYDFSKMNLLEPDIFSEYMKGCAMDIIPQVKFDNKEFGDPDTYTDYTAYIGSFYCGGNVGSMIYDDVKPMNFNRKVIIFDKLVGGCNNAIVKASTHNALYEGGLIGAPNATTGNKVELTLNGLKLRPMRWVGEKDANGNYTSYTLDANGNRQLEYNTIDSRTGQDVAPVLSGLPTNNGTAEANDLNRRFTHGNVYGGCYSSGIINGNVVINIDTTTVERELLFDVVKSDEDGEEISLYGENPTDQATFTITERKTGVILAQQGMDVLGSGLNVFGGGKGTDTEIWGSTTINMNEGYTFQVFGGSEEGVIGKRMADGNNIPITTLNIDGTYSNGIYAFNGKQYQYSTAYNCYVNLKGEYAGVTKGSTENDPRMAEAEFVYGGGFFGPICGNTFVNLGKGRIFESFGGSCNADILGHAETYIGRMVRDEYQNNFGSHVNDESAYEEGFPWIRDYTYGGNDLGGLIKQAVDFSGKVPADYITSGKIHKNNTTNVLTANAYTEYLQGHAKGIFGGCYGTYDYTDPKFKKYFYTTGDSETTTANLSDPKPSYSKPYMINAFVNFRPLYSKPRNEVAEVYGAGQGQPGEKARDNTQDRSYVLIDIPQEMEYYTGMEVFGAGAWGGVGMRTFLAPTTTADADLDAHSTIIDLVRGQINAVYGGSYREGITRRTVVNVCESSTIKINNIFGGAYGTDILPPCDVYESNVNYHNTSENALVGTIYGGNNNQRRTLYTHINISSPVWSDKTKGYMAYVYGAGKGLNTWAEYTEVNLLEGAKVYEVYGGGEMGHVLNAESIQAYMQLFKNTPSAQIIAEDSNWGNSSRWINGNVGGELKDAWKDAWKTDWKNAWQFGPDYGDGNNYYIPNEAYNNYLENTNTNLCNTGMVRTAEMDDRDYSDLTAAEKAKRYKKYNTNVIINKGANVMNYAYGGGWGKASVSKSGDVYGATYIALLGGTVKKDIYAAGTSGSVDDIFGVGARSSNNPNGGFTASANVYVEGGTCRNVYGGGWEGAVGKHTGLTNANGEVIDMIAGDITDDVYGETHVVIGIPSQDNPADNPSDYGFYKGVPAVQRNAYGGGEGGPIYGTAHLTLNNGYIGYEYNANGTDNTATPRIDELYEEKIVDDTYKDKDGHFVANQNLYDSGCMFGGGYVDNSSVDITVVKMYGGHVRNALFGGGEIAAIGRGVINASGPNNSIRTLDKIYKAGKTNVEMFGGHVHRNVFGGGRGYNNLGEHGTLYSDGYVFGQTEVHIHGGEIGTNDGLALEYGNVFGGGDIGYVYSAYEYDDNGVTKLGRGIKNVDKEGYYYRHKISSTGTFDDDDDYEKDNNELIPTEDCKVLIEPHCKVTADDGVSFTGIYYAKGAVVSESDLKYLKANPTTYSTQLAAINSKGIVTAASGITFDRSYAKGEYVPVYALNTLGNKNASAAQWNTMDDFGIIIHNAVFAGGNTASGSATVYANATSVFGNATASLHDAYHRDFITMGTGHLGGLYGDGNLTFVDGYRGLNITNYGTDYYSIDKEVTISQYHELPEREAAYYELKYKCKTACVDKDGTHYNPASSTTKASTITADDLFTLFLTYNTTTHEYESVTDGGTPILEKQSNGEWAPNPTYWEESGVLPVYAGRLLNSIQRADFCGVFGSRMVLQGAQDRVPEEVDYTNYTINRVREVSLNQQHSIIPDDLILKPEATPAANSEDQPLDDYVDLSRAIHGNYFGIYNIVNYLGALTSDVHFTDRRETENTSNDSYAEDNKTYYEWKSAYHNESKRNNGSSLNKVALASGVYLELTTEDSQGTGLNEKDWGYITGIIELDLINVQTGIGGGFVYAKNEHREYTYNKKTHATLTALNADAVSRKDFDYTGRLVEWETSGNFVHSTQTIIDDCYNISGKYMGDDAVPAHYWYIKGSVYVYDQYISAYTGSPNAYSETVDIPLTITAASHGTMKLLDVQPNRYAYYSAYNSNTSSGTVLEDGKKMIINDVTFYKNDPISYWDWFLLSKSEKNLFIPETYVTVTDCKLNGTTYPAGSVLLPSEYNSLKAIASQSANQHVVETGAAAVPAVISLVEDEQGNLVEETDEQGNNIYKAFSYAFRESNNMRHGTGYILTYKVNNPTEWNTWYTEENDGSNDASKPREKNQTGGNGYEDGPTYHLISNNGEVLGQRDYKKGDIISQDVETTYQGMGTNKPTSGQATFVPAYIVTKQISNSNGNLYPGTTVSQSEGLSYGEEKAAPAYICTSTIKLNQTEYIYLNTKMSLEEKNKYKTDYPDLAAVIEASVVPAYYCTEPGLYGGNHYVSGVNYRGLEAWSSMSPKDRKKFAFNYDALDLLVDSTYSGTEGRKYQYDSAAATLEGAEANEAGYSLVQHVDYTAEYNGTEALTYTNDGGQTASASTGTTLSRKEFERLTNEQRHYSPISPKKSDNSNEWKIYVVNTAFQVGSTPYAVGQSITENEYNNLSQTSEQEYVTVIGGFTQSNEDDTYYYCRESYEIPTDGHAVICTMGNYIHETYAIGSTVPVGAIIEKTSTTEGSVTYSGYVGLTNNQKNFTIHGIAPTETSTLYVSRNSDIFDLSTEKIITVIYQYDYEESDVNGNVTPVSERHVVNIHITFKSGIPTVEDIKAPGLVLPGSFIGLREPNVTPGAYEVTGGGWELFEKKSDAESHTNAIEYAMQDPLYWYQDGYYLAYYAKTYLGKTYSNYVPVSVANYHDLKDIMDAEHHYYIDKANVKRDPKIYINDYSDAANGLDLLKGLVDLTYSKESAVNTYGALDTPGNITGAGNLDIILRSDIDHSGTPWTSIANETGECFSGSLHGDGHHLKGLNNSLFNHLCGEVYNLGVSGTFTGAGIAETGGGYVENCWISTTGTPTKVSGENHFAVFADPTRDEGDERGPVQVVNSYYPESNDYQTPPTGDSYKHGRPTQRPDKSFYNGEVAYDLNGFYLKKRYYHGTNLGAGEGVTRYDYIEDEANGELSETMKAGYYPNSYALYLPKGTPKTPYLGYVESRFYDGDFRYAGKSIPDEVDIRLRIVTEKDQNNNDVDITYFPPIWPDDYLFFGQSLNYGQVAGRTHQDVPSSIRRSAERLLASDVHNEGNRVLRAPAYYRSGEMSTAYFNPYAVFADTKKDADNVIAYKDMTAIDFTGYNDVTSLSGSAQAYKEDWTTWSKYAYKTDISDDKYAFYPPLLDDGVVNSGLTGFMTFGLTQNLLVYTDAPGGTGSNETPTATQNTANVVSTYLTDEAYADHETNSTYHTVKAWDSHSTNLNGHWVQKSETGYIADRDHFLVDKEDFNAPISYTFESGKRMWHQRDPEYFVDRKKGWEAISLPFTADIVTTSQKGEITHFYNESETSKNGTNTKIGHEYWLREFTGNTKEDVVNNATVTVADFNYPALPNDGSEIDDKTVTNTFLWDYYYYGVSHEQKDYNSDIYQEYYSNGNRQYANYAYLTKGKPYLIGFPGATYYEFDLSGQFEAGTTADGKNPVKLSRQTITFASATTGITIGVSDEEMDGVSKTNSNKKYSFKPNYLNMSFKAGSDYYTLDAEYDSDNDGKTDCSRFGKVPDAPSSSEETVPDTKVSAFRPYFMSGPVNGSRVTRSILFSQTDETLPHDSYEGHESANEPGTLSAYPGRHKITVKSTLNYTTDVRIVNTAGQTIAKMTLQPGDTIETRINLSGVYIVQSEDGLFVRKLAVK